MAPRLHAAVLVAALFAGCSNLHVDAPGLQVLEWAEDYPDWISVRVTNQDDEGTLRVGYGDFQVIDANNLVIEADYSASQGQGFPISTELGPGESTQGDLYFHLVEGTEAPYRLRVSPTFAEPTTVPLRASPAS